MIDVRDGSQTFGSMSARRLVGRDEPKEEAIQQPRRVLVERGEPGGVEGTPPAEAGEFGEEWATGGHEQGDGLGQARARGGQPTGQVVDEIRRVGLGAGAARDVVDDRRPGARRGRVTRRRPSCR